MAERYEDWLRILKKYKASIKEDLRQIRACKAEIQSIKDEFLEELGAGKYIRDDKRIVISAPEIIIGDVFKDGTLRNTGTSKVIVRGNQIRQEAAYDEFGNSSITNKAVQIRNICVDPGIDGNEAVVAPNSRFSVQAEGITLQSECTLGTFAETPTASDGEIKIVADNHIALSAQPPLTRRKTLIEKIIQEKDDEKNRLEQEALPTIDFFRSKFVDYQQSVELGNLNPHMKNMDMYQDICKKKREVIRKNLDTFQDKITKLATIKFEKEYLTLKKRMIENSIRQGYNPAAVDIVAARTNVYSIDEDLKVCNQVDAGLRVQAKKVDISAVGEDGVLDDSAFVVNTKDIKLSTNNWKRGQNPNSIDMESQGSVTICSKDIRLEAVDKEQQRAGAPVKEKALARNGKIVMRAENLAVRTNKTDGKLNGKVEINSQHIAMRTDDLNPDTGKRTPSTEGDIKLWAHTIMGGYYAANGREKSSLMLGSGNMSFNGFKKTEVKQGTGNTMLQMEDGKAYLKGSQSEVSGKLDIVGKTTFKSLVSLTDATVKNLEVQSYIKTPNSMEGNKIPGAAAADPNRKEYIPLEEKYNAIKKKEEEERKKEEEERKKKEEEEKKRREQLEKEQEERRKELQRRADEEQRQKNEAGGGGMEYMVIQLK